MALLQLVAPNPKANKAAAVVASARVVVLVAKADKIVALVVPVSTTATTKADKDKAVATSPSKRWVPRPSLLKRKSKTKSRPPWPVCKVA